MSNQQKCNNCGAKDHIAKFCYERTKKVPTQKLNSREKKEMKIQKKEEEIIIQVQKKIPQSKYEEDKYIGQHTQIWGSYWNEVLGWGFACCYSNQKSHRNAWEKRENDNPSLKKTPLAQQELKSGPLNLNELYRKSNLREGAPVDIIYNQSNAIEF